jgi:hypothetical protein
LEDSIVMVAALGEEWYVRRKNQNRGTAVQTEKNMSKKRRAE